MFRQGGRSWPIFLWISFGLSVLCLSLLCVSIGQPWYYAQNYYQGNFFYKWGRIELYADQYDAKGNSWSYSEVNMSNVLALNVVVLILMCVSTFLWLIFTIHSLIALIRLVQSQKYFSSVLGNHNSSQKNRFFISVSTAIGIISIIALIVAWASFCLRPAALSHDDFPSGQLQCVDAGGPCSQFSGAAMVNGHKVLWGPYIGWGFAVSITVFASLAVVAFAMGHKRTMTELNNEDADVTVLLDDESEDS
eukprot:TRINITY_DN9807_c0_g3_i1.p1 TRINITY_DN9807_c0_g3~~TRINITY_DN9807_c0_g3_i1.p1  ORF type:complete len:249 (+),score=18.43 TRINITY_DN9807_c0_g3_i1:43-789(+)